MNERLRIIQVVNVRWFNATAWYGLFLSRLLKEAGHEVLVLGLPGTASFAKASAMGLAPLALALNTANPLRMVSLMRRLADLVRDFRPHVVNCHRGEGMALWGLLKVRGSGNAPGTASCGGGLPGFALVRTRGDQRPPCANFANRLLYNTLADAVVATNSRTREQCRTFLHTPEHLLHLVPGGVDTRFFVRREAGGAEVRQRYGLAGDAVVIGLLGRFDAVKGQRELLEAVARIRSTPGLPADSPLRRVRVLLMGFASSTSERTVQDWISAYGLEDCAVITGKVESVPDHLSALDIGVIASQGSEAIARAAFEIMACRVPLVGTDVGVMPDLLSEQALVPPAHPEALARLLERAVVDASFRGALQGEQHRRMQTLSDKDFLEQTLLVYRAALHFRPHSC